MGTMDRADKQDIVETNMEKWVVAYAKILMDKDTGIILQGVYFGGLGETQDEAHIIARDCVNTIKGGIILPKVLKITDSYCIIDALYDAADRFENITRKMQEADDIINNGLNK